MIRRYHVKHKGFTLIELLMVVAIIAVLATIAIPNLLEAQTRSKVARARADIRTLAGALEAYATDNNRYPYCNPAQDHSWLSDIPALTTPIGYLTKLPPDVFPPLEDRNPRRQFYRYYPIAYWNLFYPELRLRSWKWIIMSNGPDRRIDIDRENAQDAINGLFWMVYDATNGTISRGDIWATNQGMIGGGS